MCEDFDEFITCGPIYLLRPAQKHIWGAGFYDTATNDKLETIFKRAWQRAQVLI